MRFLIVPIRFRAACVDGFLMLSGVRPRSSLSRICLSRAESDCQDGEPEISVGRTPKAGMPGPRTERKTSSPAADYDAVQRSGPAHIPDPDQIFPLSFILGPRKKLLLGSNLLLAMVETIGGQCSKMGRSTYNLERGSHRQPISFEIGHLRGERGWDRRLYQVYMEPVPIKPCITTKPVVPLPF